MTGGQSHRGTVWGGGGGRVHRQAHGKTEAYLATLYSLAVPIARARSEIFRDTNRVSRQ